MRLLDLYATPHASGHQIDLTWTRPAQPTHPGVRVVRRLCTYPQLPDDGTVVITIGPNSDTGTTDAEGRTSFTVEDAGLRGGEIYYYAFFPFAGDPPSYAFDSSNRISALAGSYYDAAGQMRDLLPALYARYDAAESTSGGASGDAGNAAGPLARLLAVVGGELDVLRTEAEALLDLYAVDRIDGDLLPLLAQWIGWRSDFRQSVAAQRSEVRFAPELYRRVGLIPTVEATVKRISGWESQTKEFVHNVARTNTPPRLTIWRQGLDADGAPLDEPLAAWNDADPSLRLLSIDEAHDGRPSVANGPLGIRRLVYHTRRKTDWQIWQKTSPTADVSGDVAGQLEDAGTPGTVSARLQDAFLAAGYGLAEDATVSMAVPDQLWQIEDATRGETYVLEAVSDGPWTLYHTSAPPTEWAPSRPLAVGGGVLKRPVITRQGSAVWVVWEAWRGGACRLHYRRREAGNWSDVHTLRYPHAPGEGIPERRSPSVVVPGDGQLWFVWMERMPTGWQAVSAVHDGSVDADGALSDAGWATAAPVPVAMTESGASVPLAVGTDLQVVASAPGGDPPLVLLWSRPVSVPAVHPGATRHRVFASVLPSLTTAEGAWTSEEPLPATDPADHDREPSALPRLDGTWRVVWSATRDGSWSVWTTTLDPSATPPTWDAPQAVTEPPFDHRAPLLLAPDSESAAAPLLLLTRTDRSIRYESDLYGATATEDPRYSGAQTVRVTNGPRIRQRGELRDVQAYTYDAGPPVGAGSGASPSDRRTDRDWYARDTVGLYVEPDTVEADTLARGVDRLKRVVPEFIPVTDRAVVILPSYDVSPPPHTDYVYRYDAPPGSDAAVLGDAHADVLTSVATDATPTPTDVETATITAVSTSAVPPSTDDTAAIYTSRDRIRVESIAAILPPDSASETRL